MGLLAAPWTSSLHPRGLPSCPGSGLVIPVLKSCAPSMPVCAQALVLAAEATDDFIMGAGVEVAWGCMGTVPPVVYYAAQLPRAACCSTPGAVDLVL
jgi:hypothetical protein